VGDQKLVEAVKSAKRTPLYRSQRAVLACVSPEDVWADSEAGVVFVVFLMRSPPDSTLGFVIDSSTRQIVRSGIVTMEINGDVLEVRNRTLPDPLDAGPLR
jgi:hypothetical protein